MGGVYRCYFSDNPDDCLPDLAPCSFSDECCCLLCAPDSEGDFVCCPGGVDCVPNGGACVSDADCCDLHCVDGVCQPPDIDCVPMGGECVVDEDCCAGLICNPETGRCYFLMV